MVQRQASAGKSQPAELHSSGAANWPRYLAPEDPALIAPGPSLIEYQELEATTRQQGKIVCAKRPTKERMAAYRAGL